MPDPHEEQQNAITLRAPMKAQRRFGVNRSWLGIVTVFLVDVWVLALASNWPPGWDAHHIAWWVGVAVAAVLAILTLITVRGISPLAAAGGWLRNRSGDPLAALMKPCTPAIDHRRKFGRDVVGIREFEGRLVAAIEVAGLADVPSGRHHQSMASVATLPLDAVAAALHQFDLRLDAIDIVSVQAQAGRRTWLVLRMDPHRNAAAVATRDSLASTLTVCAERLAQDLDRRRCVARPLSADELAEMDAEVLAGLQPAWRRPGWRRLADANGVVTSFWVSPHDLSPTTLDELWLVDADATVVTIRVTDRAARPEVSAWVRYHSAERLDKSVWSGLNPLTGRQLAAVRASLPAPAARPQLLVPSRPLSEPFEVSLGPVGHPEDQ